MNGFSFIRIQKTRLEKHVTCAIFSNRDTGDRALFFHTSLVSKYDCVLSLMDSGARLGVLVPKRLEKHVVFQKS